MSLPSLGGRLAYLRLEAGNFIKHSLLVLVIAKLTMWRRLRKGPVGSNLRILILRTDGLGDFVLTTPFLREIRRNFPTSHITLLTGVNVKDLALMCPHADRVEIIDPRGLTVYALADLIKFVRVNLYGRFDLALLPRWDVDLYWSTLIACLSGAPRIIAYTRRTSPVKTFLNWGYDSLVTDTLRGGNKLHEIDRALAIVDYLGGTVHSRALELWTSVADKSEAEHYLNATGAMTRLRPWVALGIGATESRKQWPYFAELLAEMSHRMTFTAFVFVTSDELGKANELKKTMPGCVVVCQPLRVAAEIMGRCNIFVGNDSGALHVAVAAGLPSVEISCHPEDGDPTAQYSPARFGHVGKNGRAVQPRRSSGSCLATCVEHFPHCISMVTPEQVMAAIESLIGVPA